MTTEKLALDVRSWLKSPEVIAGDLAAASQEMRKGTFAQRISFVPLVISSDGKINDQSLGALENYLSSGERPFDHLENAAFLKLQDWAASHEQGYAIWISPPYSDENECRFCVYELITDKGEKKMFLRGICADFNGQECLQIGRQISRSSPKDQPLPLLATVEQLRSTPLVFEPKNDQDWLDFLTEKIDLPEVWQAIRQGQDIRARQELLKQTSIVARQFVRQIAEVKTRDQAIWVGAMIEQAVQSRTGIVFQAVGSCGMSNQAALARSAGGIFNVMHGLGHKEKSEGTYVKECPYCHTQINKVIYPGFECSCGQVFHGSCGGGTALAA